MIAVACRPARVSRDDRLDHAVAHEQRGVVVPDLAVEDPGAGEGEAVAHSVSVTLRRLRRLVGIEAACAREGLDEGVEGDDQRQRIGQRMAGRGKGSDRACLGTRRGDEDRRALGGERVGGLGDRGSEASRAASASTGKPGPTSASGPCITSAAL